MLHIELTARIVNGNVVFPYQNEVENLALETIGTHESIYSEPVPMTDDFCLVWNDPEKGWVLEKADDKDPNNRITKGMPFVC